jgi:hypothetical protein
MAQQREYEKNYKDVEKDLRNSGGSECDSCEPKNCREKRNNEKYQGPTQHDSLLCMAVWRKSGCGAAVATAIPTTDVSVARP